MPAAQQAADLVRLRWRALLAGPAAGLAVALAATAATPPTYRAETTLLVSVPGQGNVRDALQGVQLSAQLLASYAELATSARAASDVARRLDGRLSPAQVAASVDVRPRPPGLVLAVEARAGDRRTAAEVADATAAVLVERIDRSEEGRPDPVTAVVIDRARPPASRAAPRPRRNLATGLLVGSAAGLLLALARQALDRRVRTAHAVAVASGLPHVGTVARRRRWSPIRAEDLAPVRTALRFGPAGGGRPRVGGPARRIVVTGARTGDGASTAAAGLAGAWAEAGAPVVLVDADLRRTGLPAFAPGPGPGLADLLARPEHDPGGDRARPAASRVRYVGAGAAGPSGRLGPAVAARVSRAADLLSGPRLDAVLDTLADGADAVVVDAPALLDSAEAAVLAARADVVLLVVRWGRTRLDDVEAAARRLRLVGAPAAGFVLNADPDRELAYVSPSRGAAATNAQK